VPIERFIPLPGGASDRHVFIERYGAIDVYVFDPYSIALSKIDRGFDSDIDDVVFLIQRTYIDLVQLEKYIDVALQRSAEFDLDPQQMWTHFEMVQKRLSR
jgi:hypothetical protein